MLSAAAALTLVCAAGCSAARSSYAPSGLEKQVSNGERISAATRAHESRQNASAPAAPAPAAVRSRIGGSQVIAIGDSVMAAYEPYCDGAFECWTTKHLENFVNVIAGSASRVEP